MQNHSQGHDNAGQNLPTLLEEIGISNALNYGRSGRGVVMVRAAGNLRTTEVNADDDGYPNDPRVIAVGAVRIDGRVASFSNPGSLPAGRRAQWGSGLYSKPSRTVYHRPARH